MKIQAPHVANLFNYASFKGIPESELRSLLLTPSLDVCNPEEFISDMEFLNVFKSLMERSNDTYFGLHYGCFLNIKALGFITQLSLNSSSIRQAVFILQNYLENSFPIVALDIIEKNGNCILTLDSSIEDFKAKNNILDIAYSFIYRELKLMIPSELHPKLEIPYEDINEYSNFLNYEVQTGKNYSFIFDALILDTEINKKTAKSIEILLPQFLKMIDKKKVGYKSFSIQVRNLVLNMCSPELPSFDQVITHFPLSTRSFQRKLSDEGLSFRKITDDIKHELSSYLTKGDKMKTHEIAYILGYSESSSYLHAAKKWKKEHQF